MLDQVDHEVAVIGAGPGGIAAGIMLKRAGITDFVILERAGEVGGSWRDNTYPGIGVDMYHADVARRFGLGPHLRFHTDVVRERWDEGRHRWLLSTVDGRTITARFVVNAVGAFINPKQDPGIPGVDDFVNSDRPTEPQGYRDGTQPQSTGCPHRSLVRNRRIEFRRGGLAYQRTPVWCLPKPDFELRGWMRAALRIPGLAALLHGAGLAAVEVGCRVLVSTPLWAAAPMMRAFDAGATRAYRAYLRRVVRDPALAEQLLPSYGPVAKRPTLSNDFLRTFNRANTSLITTPIERITRTGILTTDGIQHDLDMIVLATGYHLFSDPESYLHGAVVGRDGFDLGRFFAEHRLQAYESVALPKLPNRWMIVGPYSWTGTGWHALWRSPPGTRPGPSPRPGPGAPR